MAAASFNERSRLGHGTKKVARMDKRGYLRWQNAVPDPADNIEINKLPKGFISPLQGTMFTMEDVKGWLHVHYAINTIPISRTLG